MKIGSFPIVQRTIEARAHLLRQLESCTIVVTIDGVAQDDLMLERLRPHVQAELRLRLSEMNEDLRQLGVEV